MPDFPLNMPRLSIIIATYNAAATLARCLDSIVTQTFNDWEIIIVDGGSFDGTLDIIHQSEDAIAYWHSHPDAGIYDAWNQALARARGEYVCFLGADDAFNAPNTLARVFAAIDNDQRYDIVSSRGQLRDSTWRQCGEFGTPWHHSSAPRRLGVCHPGMLHHRTLFERYGRFDTSYRIVADLDFLLRLPPDAISLHLDFVTVDVQDDGISRRQFWQRIRERRHVHAACPRVGPTRAWLYWVDKAWRRPIALALHLPH